MREKVPEMYYQLSEASKERLLYPFLLQQIRFLFKRGATLIDYGCGNGEFAWSLAREGYVVRCFDQSEIAVRYAKAGMDGLPNMSVDLVRGNRLTNVTDNSADSVFCILVLMMISEAEEILQILGEFSRCLKPTGRTVIAVTHPCSRRVRFPSFYNCLPDGFRHERSGIAYTVNIRKPEGSWYQLTDYHWTLPDYIEFLEKARLRVLKVWEPIQIINPLTRWDTDWNRSVSYPPYLVLLAEKSAHAL